jgi:hypothetical protein
LKGLKPPTVDAMPVLCHHCHQEDRLAATCHQIQDLG